MLRIQSFTFNALAEKTYVLHDDTRQCAIVDPGCYERHEQEALRQYITQEKLTVVQLLNTHGHVDHVLGNAFVKRIYGVPLHVHPLDEATLRSVVVYAPMYGIHRYEPAEPDGHLHEGDEIVFGETRLRVLFLPGHAPGHIGFYAEADGVLFSGDVLFRQSVGRTDLPGGSHATLIRSIAEKLLPLPDAVGVYPGHGAPTTIGAERLSNPFLQ